MDKKHLKIIIPKNFMNVSITNDNFFIADTNDSVNWDFIKLPLPKGNWKIYSEKDKTIILVNDN
jgi:hypothetical protein